MLKARVLGIDLGERRIGLAISDPLGITAQPLATIKNQGKKTLGALMILLQQHAISRIVIGLPKHMHGEEGEGAVKARAFGDKMTEQSGLPVEFMDERLTTQAINRMLSETEMSGSRKRQVVDKLAAVLILQTWLDRQRS